MTPAGQSTWLGWPASHHAAYVLAFLHAWRRLTSRSSDSGSRRPRRITRAASSRKSVAISGARFARSQPLSLARAAIARAPLRWNRILRQKAHSSSTVQFPSASDSPSSSIALRVMDPKNRPDRERATSAALRSIERESPHAEPVPFGGRRSRRRPAIAGPRDRAHRGT